MQEQGGRTCDQKMVPAARSAKQNIIEGIRRNL